MLAEQKEYDANHHALTVAKVVDEMADYMVEHAPSEAVGLLQHPDWEIRQASARALAKLKIDGRRDIAIAVARAVETEANIYVLSALTGVASATRCSEASLAMCSIIENCADEWIRRKAVWTQNVFRDPKAVPVLLRALDDPSESVARAVPYALGLIKDRRAVPKLCSIARDPRAATRVGAVQALGMIGDPSCAATLRGLLTSRDEGLVKGVIWSLGRAPDDKTVAALLPFLEHTSHELAEGARESLL